VRHDDATPEPLQPREESGELISRALARRAEFLSLLFSDSAKCELFVTRLC
jgi:hypothetical protein